MEDTVAHLVYDDPLLYAVDTGNNRILAIDTSTGVIGSPLSLNDDGLGRDKFNYLDTVDFWVAVDTAAAGMTEPAGMELHDGVMYVTDHAQGFVYAFDLATGALLDSLDLGVGAGALQGMGIQDDGTLWFTNEQTDEVFRLVSKLGAIGGGHRFPVDVRPKGPTGGPMNRLALPLLLILAPACSGDDGDDKFDTGLSDSDADHTSGSSGGFTNVDTHAGWLATSSTGLTYFEPGDPSQSYAFLKITGDQGSVAGGAGARMPTNGFLAQPEIDLIEAWILDGCQP